MSELAWHQTYYDGEPCGKYALLRADRGPASDSDEYLRRMGDVGRALRQAEIRTILLAHGTFVGRDVMGVVSQMEAFFPNQARKLAGAIKQFTDAMAGDVGNYPPDYVQRLEAGLNAAGGEPIAVRQFQWSGQNHHLGRADGAVRLLDELLQSPDGRVLLWGHSHAGNVFALLTHLLSGDRHRLRLFFRAARPFYRWPGWKSGGSPHWLRVRAASRSAALPAIRQRLDMVTFGTPLRYSWNMDGCSRLLHVVHHVPQPSLPDYRAAFPPSMEAILAGNRGDFVQQVGIAGTNVMPNVLAWKSWLADRRFNQLLQSGLRSHELYQRLALGCRVADVGQTVLVDYQQPPSPISQHLAGHAVYTRREWLLFHAEETVRRLYGG